MKNIKTIVTSRKKLAVLTLGVILAPHAQTQTAHAAPSPKAPAWGLKKKPSNAKNTTLRGVVKINSAGNDFTLNADNGRSYRVITRNEPARLSNGDRVTVQGWIEDNIFVAERVSILNNETNQNSTGTMVLNGEVTNDFAGDSFQMQAANGLTYIVVTRNEPNLLKRNSRVHVVGTAQSDGRTVFANSVRLMTAEEARNYIKPKNAYVGGNMNFMGVVTRIASPFRLDVRADNARNYSINSIDQISNRTSIGDRVQIVGQDLGNDIIRATAVKITKDTNASRTVQNAWKPNAQSAVINFPGRIEKAATMDKANAAGGKAILSVRGDNGQLYSVRYQTNKRFTVGQRVRVVGKMNGGIVYASSITK